MATVSAAEKAMVLYRLGLPSGERAPAAFGALRMALGDVYTVTKGLEYMSDAALPIMRVILARLENIANRYAQLDDSAEYSAAKDLVRNANARGELSGSYRTQQVELLKILGIPDFRGAILGLGDGSGGTPLCGRRV